MSRKLDDWINAYLKYTENSEPPQSYHLWIGMGAIASALQRKVFIRWGRSMIHPNLYIVLVGPSGRAKKGTALEFVKPLLQRSKVRVMEGAITRQKLIRRMAMATEDYIDPATGRIKLQCAVTFLSEELQVFLGVQNVPFLADLCNWYDCPEVWEYDTKGAGTDTLIGVCFNVIAATAPDWLPSILPREAIGGGWASRNIWVVEDDKGKTVEEPTYDQALEELLANDLEQIALISGEYQFSANGKAWYKSWYRNEEEAARHGKYPVMDPKFSGYCERRATLIKKLGIIMSASEYSEKVIRQRHLERALMYMRRTERKMGRAFGGLGSARYALATELILGFVIKHKTVTRTQVLRFFYRDIDDYTFDVVVRTLDKMGMVEVIHQTGKDEVIVNLKTDKIDYR